MSSGDQEICGTWYDWRQTFPRGVTSGERPEREWAMRAASPAWDNGARAGTLSPVSGILAEISHRHGTYGTQDTKYIPIQALGVVDVVEASLNDTGQASPHVNTALLLRIHNLIIIFVNIDDFSLLPCPLLLEFHWILHCCVGIHF